MSELTIADRLAIQEILYRYSHCIDRGRWEELPALFTEDCCLDLSQVLGRYEGSAGIRQFTETLRSVGIFMRHFVSNIVVEGDSERAHASAYVIAITGPAGSTPRQTTGFYEDELRKQDGRWLLHRRQLTLDVSAA